MKRSKKQERSGPQISTDIEKTVPSHFPNESTKPSKRSRKSLPKLAFNASESAHILGVSRPTFTGSILDEIDHLRVGRRIIVPLTSLEEWLEQNKKSSSDKSDKQERGKQNAKTKTLE